jgi:deoxyribonuclease-4
VLQIFVKNNARWEGKPISEAEARAFRSAVRGAGLLAVCAHASYLINLASSSSEIRRRSVAALADELERCARLGIPDLVLHPGSHGGEGELAGVARIAAGLDEAFRRARAPRVRLLLEGAAGQGACVGHRFEHLRDIAAASRHPDRLGVCLDTCHTLAAGYDIATEEGWDRTVAALDAAFGLARLRAIHANDSRRPLGSRVDRHGHIGAGFVGRGGFASLMRDPRLAAIPKYLETPKDPRLDWDRRNLARLRRLAG